jgi:hypothetical protein
MNMFAEDEQRFSTRKQTETNTSAEIEAAAIMACQ